MGIQHRAFECRWSARRRPGREAPRNYVLKTSKTSKNISIETWAEPPFPISAHWGYLRLRWDNVCTVPGTEESPHTRAPFLPLSCVSSRDTVCLFHNFSRPQKKSFSAAQGQLL